MTQPITIQLWGVYMPQVRKFVACDGDPGHPLLVFRSKENALVWLASREFESPLASARVVPIGELYNCLPDEENNPQ